MQSGTINESAKPHLLTRSRWDEFDEAFDRQDEAKGNSTLRLCRRDLQPDNIGFSFVPTLTLFFFFALC